jgi:hypothetical protein
VCWAAPTPPTDILVWVRETQIWYGSENLHLYYTWRRSRGSYDTVESHPGHLLHYFEIEDVVSVIHMSLLFGWGASLAADFFHRGFHIDHDSHGRLLAHQETNWPEVHKELMLQPSRSR